MSAATFVRKTEEERKAEVDAINEELQAAVLSLASSDNWRRMVETAARFPRYSFTNQILLWMQAEERGVSISRVAAFGTWKRLGYNIRAKSKAFKIYQPIKTRLRPDEVAKWRQEGKNPLDGEGRPKMVLRGFKLGSVFDVAQVEPGEGAQDLDAGRAWVEQEGNGPEGVWDALVTMTETAGFTVDVRPATPLDGGAHGSTNYTTRIVWINSDCDEAERVRILAHETAGHIMCQHEDRDISRAQGECEADSVAYIVLRMLGMDISSSSVDYVAGWSGGDVEILKAAAAMVSDVASEVYAEVTKEES